MAMPARFWVYLAVASAVWAGVALGAESQKEEFLEPSLALQQADIERSASGNLIILTAFVVALSAGVAAALLSRTVWHVRTRAALGLFLAVYVLTVLVQTSWPNVNTCVSEDDVCSSLTFSINPLASNQDAVPSLLIPILAGVLATVLGAGASLRALFPSTARPDSPAAFLARFTAAIAIAAPFLAIAAWGNLRLLIALPEGQAGVGGYLVVLPAAALACLAILGAICLQAWHWGAFVRNGRLAATTEQAWRGTRWALRILAGGVAALALFGVLLPTTGMTELELGRTFGVTLRGHTQFLFLLVVPLLPLMRMQRAGVNVLERHGHHSHTLEVSGLHPQVLALYLAVAASFVLAGLATFFMDGALWAWILAFAPLVVLCVRLHPAGAAPILLVAAFAAWAAGNTIEGSFDSESGRLDLVTSAGILALWRLAGAVLAGVAVFRLAAVFAPPSRGRTWAATACALALGALLLLELPLAAWVVTRAEGQSVGIGSLLSSQDHAVRTTMHVAAALLSIAAAVAVARTWRPDWFRRRATPMSAPIRSKAAG